MKISVDNIEELNELFATLKYYEKTTRRLRILTNKLIKTYEFLEKEYKDLENENNEL